MPQFGDLGSTLFAEGEPGGKPPPVANEPMWDYWTALTGLLGDYEPADIQMLQKYLGGQKRWKPPKKAQDMLALAQMFKDLGDDESATQLAMASLSQGFNRPQWNLSSIFGPALSQWGLGFGQPQQQGRARPNAGASGQDLSGLLASLLGG